MDIYTIIIFELFLTFFGDFYSLNKWTKCFKKTPILSIFISVIQLKFHS